MAIVDNLIEDRFVPPTPSSVNRHSNKDMAAATPPPPPPPPAFDASPPSAAYYRTPPPPPPSCTSSYKAKMQAQAQLLLPESDHRHARRIILTPTTSRRPTQAQQPPMSSLGSPTPSLLSSSASSSSLSLLSSSSCHSMFSLDGNNSQHSIRSFGSATSLSSVTSAKSNRTFNSTNTAAGAGAGAGGGRSSIGTTSTSNTSFKEMRVTFGRRAKVYPILDIRDYTTEEIQDKYWSTSELSKIRDQILIDVKNLDYDYNNKGITYEETENNGIVECLRGIEVRTSLGAKRRISYKIKSRQALRVEQEKQYKQSLSTKGKQQIVDSEQLAYVCIMANRLSKDDAIELGKQDEFEVLNWRYQ